MMGNMSRDILGEQGGGGMPPGDDGLVPFAVERSPTIGAIAMALAKAQGTMTHAPKDAVNPHFKNRYATLASCLDTVRGPLSANGIAILQLPDDAGDKGIAVVTWLVHSSGEWFRGRLYLPARQQDAQGLGGAISYARRYSLMSMVGIASDDDDDAQASVQQTRAATQAKPDPVRELANGFADRLDHAATRAQFDAVVKEIAASALDKGAREWLKPIAAEAAMRIRSQASAPLAAEMEANS